MESEPNIAVLPGDTAVLYQSPLWNKYSYAYACGL